MIHLGEDDPRLYYINRMVDQQKRERRIVAAQQLADLCHSGDRMINDSHRQAWIHDQIADTVKQSCAKSGGGQHFTQAQIESLTEIAFNIAYLVDPKNKKKHGIIAGIKSGWAESSLANKVSIIGGAITIGGAVSAAAIFLWVNFVQPHLRLSTEAVAGQSQGSKVSSAPAANTQTKPATQDD